MREPDTQEIIKMFLAVTKLVIVECGNKDFVKLKAMQYALVLAAEAAAEELKEREK